MPALPAIISPLTRDVVPLTGFAAFLAVTDFLFWGGAFATAAGNPYGPLHVIALYSVPCFLTAGALLVLLAHHPQEGPLARVPRRPHAILFSALLMTGSCVLAGLVCTPQAHPAALAATSIVIGAGIAGGFSCWAHALRTLAEDRLVTTVGGACLLFPLASLVIAFMPAAPAWLIIGALACYAGLATRHETDGTHARQRDGNGPSPAEQPTTRAEQDRPTGPLPGTWRAYGTVTLGFGAFGFIAGFSRTMSLVAVPGVDNLAVTLGSPLFVFAAGAAITARWALRNKRVTPGAFFRLGVPVAASGLVLFSVAGAGFGTAFACFGNAFFEFMLVIVTIDALAMRRDDPVSSYALALGGALVLAAGGTVMGLAVQTWWHGDTAGFSLTVVVCIYVLAMALMLQARGRGSRADEQAGSTTDDTRSLEDMLNAQAANVAATFQLTPREQQILALVLRGADGPAMADQLGLSENTVRSHRKRLYAKLGVHSKRELLELVRDERVQD